MHFNIGDVVRVKNEVATVVDRLYSEIEGRYLYRLRFEGEDRTNSAFFLEEDIVSYMAEPNKNYIVETEILNNVVIIKIFKSEKDSLVKEELVRGHGHIIHEGDVGIVQALSYALKKAYEKINGGNF